MTVVAAFWPLGDEDAAPRVAAMLAAQAIWGPEPAALRRLGPVTVGRRTHPALLDDGRGPLVGGDGTLLLVGDLRVDNRGELADALGLCSGERDAMGDSALTLRLVERWGIAALGRIVGAMAVILWDAHAQTLTLARDFIGEKPLHYWRGDGRIAVATMPAGLHALPELPYAPDEETMADFLALLPDTGTRSFFDGVERVPANSIVTVTRAGVSRAPLWQPARRTLRLGSDAAYAEALRDGLTRAVGRQLRRPAGGVAAHLSGGLDSGSVAATAALLLSPEPLDVFTAAPSSAVDAPPGRIADETALAAAVAAMHPTMRHHVVRVGGRSPLDGLDRHFRVYQRPVLNICNAVWTDAIADAAAAGGATVLLGGFGGNMTISHDGLPLLPHLLGRGQLIALARLFGQARRRGQSTKSLLAITIGPFLPPPLWRWLGDRVNGRVRLEQYSALSVPPERRAAVAARARARRLDFSYQPWADGRAQRLWTLSRVDIGLYCKGTLGGWGLELRDPTVDRDLIELSLSIPDAQYLLDGEPRSLARRAFADRLPPALLAEPRRGYQAADWHVALGTARGALATEIEALERCAPAAALIDVDRLREDVERWPSDGWTRSETIDRYRLALLRGFSAGHFLRRASRSN